jgi:adenylate cyclase
MLGAARRDVRPLEARATGEALLGGEAVSRRLAAIVGADVAGCSRLMAADQQGTLGRLKGLRHDLIDLKIRLHERRAVKSTGDGMLVEVANALEAAPLAAG